MEFLYRKSLPLGVIILTLGYVSGAGFAQDGAPAAEENAAPTADLANRQQQILRDYERFERALFDIAEQSRRKDRERAELLFRARDQSQDQRILDEMRSIAELLKGDAKFGEALTRQDDLLPRMQAVLKLLQSLDERDQVASLIKEYEERLKEANRLLANEKDIQADTKRGGDAGSLAERQRKVLENANDLAEKIDRDDAARKNEQPGNQSENSGESGENPMNSEMGENQPKEGEQPGEKPEDGSESKPEEGSESKPMGEPMEGESPESSGDPKESDSSNPMKSTGQTPPMPSSQQDQSKPPQQGGEPQEGGEQPQPGEQQQQDEEQPSPGREQLQQARREMQQALEELKGKNTKNAEKEEEDAVAKLAEMKAELEKILRQLREEEKEMYLTLLEARFQNMLRRQEQINSETKRLDDIDEGNRPATFGAKVAVIKRQQDDNALDAEKALHLLMEEGSSVAFPEAVEQMQKNMETVSRRLAKQDTGDTTQVIEQLIVETLEEMIFAMQQELEKLEEKREQQQQGQPQQQGDDPQLVNQLAELKMIRSLQNQINRLTKQIGMDIEGEQASDSDKLELLDDLAARQQRIQEATYDLSVGRNQ
ncbi:MAG: hypothetical protein R3C18_09030 [Planctomycetaceae bacterium]